MDCSICMDQIQTSKETLGEIIPCDHKFHSLCIRKWQLHKLQQDQDKMIDLRCPVCRTAYTHMNVYYDYGTPFVKKLEVDVSLGFKINAITEWHRTGEMMVDTLNEETLNKGCPLCEENVDLRTCRDTLYRCNRCKDIYHQPCLHELSVEVGTPATWRNCPECQDHLEWHTTDKNTLKVKQSIQKHVREVLDPLYKGGDQQNGITREQYKSWNQTISRQLYHQSHGIYQSLDIYNYSQEAERCLQHLMERQ